MSNPEIPLVISLKINITISHLYSRITDKLATPNTIMIVPSSSSVKPIVIGLGYGAKQYPNNHYVS